MSYHALAEWLLVNLLKYVPVTLYILPIAHSFPTYSSHLHSVPFLLRLFTFYCLHCPFMSVASTSLPSHQSPPRRKDTSLNLLPTFTFYLSLNRISIFHLFLLLLHAVLNLHCFFTWLLTTHQQTRTSNAGGGGTRRLKGTATPMYCSSPNRLCGWVLCL